MNHVGIFTLGQVALKSGLLERQHQPIVMLSYLAHTGRRDREHLAHLFWPTSPNPLNNLSSSLTRIRQQAPEALDIGTHQISVNWTTDALDMLHQLQAGRVSEALALYRGPFLDGFRLRSLGEELEAWIYETRDTIAATVANTAVEASRSLVDEGQWLPAAAMAEKAVEVGGLGPVVLDNLDYLYAILAGASRLAGQTLRTNAEAAGYVLDDVELLRPSPGAVRLQTRDWFVGCNEELAELAEAARPGEVVNVYGLGGSGKTSLARRFIAARDPDPEFPGGCHVIELASETDGDRVTEAVRAVLQPQAPPGQVAEINDMVDQPSLVLIDDVIPNASVTAALEGLAEIRSLCCVVVSRVRVDSATIRSVAVRGLSTTAGEGRSDAAQLFIQRAGKSLQLDEPGEPVSEAIEHICERVSGLPLAVELTAAWVKMLPVVEVAPLFDDEDLLDQPPPGENLSLGLVIRRTWDMLAPEAQKALSSLSIMRGGFTRAAAREVAGVGVGELTKLHDYSLIDIDDAGRITLHPLIQDFAARDLTLDATRAQALATAHRTYFASMLDEAVTALTGPDQGQTLRQIRLDHRNIEAAWLELIAARDWDTIERTVDALDTYLLRSGQLIDALRFFQAAIDGLDDGPGERIANSSLIARITNNLAWVQMLVGQDAIASQLCADGLAAAQPDDRRARIALLRTQSALLGNRGDMQGALDGYLIARDLADELGDERTRALLHEDTGRCHRGLGHFDEATAVFRETLDAARSLKDPHMEARSYLLLALTIVGREPTHAMVLLDEGAALAAAHGLDHLLAYFTKDRAFAHLALGDNRAAVEHFERSIERADEVGDQLIRADALAGLSRALLRAGDIEAALPLVQETTRAAVRVNAWPCILGLGLGLACTTIATHPDSTLANQLGYFCAQHPLLAIEETEREAEADFSEPAQPFDAASRLDETCERILQLARTLAA